MFGEESLYRLLKLEDFATFDEIDQVWHRYCEWKALTESNSFDPKIEEAFKILRDLETKQIYDMLLDAATNPQMMLPRFSSAEDVKAVEQLASLLKIQLRLVSNLTYQIVKPSDQLPNPFVERPRLTVPVGSAFIAFTAIPFSTDWDRFNEQVIIVLESDQDYAFFAHSKFGALNIGYGDRGVIIRAGLPNENPRLNAAFLNKTRDAFGLLDPASFFFFPSDNLYIAQRFGIRNSPTRIRQTMLQYYDGLAESLTRFDNRINLEVAKRALRRTAKQFHPQFI